MQDCILHVIDRQGNEDCPSHSFWCSGCNSAHAIWTTGRVAWKFNGSLEKPTFEPSFLIHASKVSPRCHLHIREGNIHYCDDCDHELKGKVVPMEKF